VAPWATRPGTRAHIAEYTSAAPGPVLGRGGQHGHRQPLPVLNLPLEGVVASILRVPQHVPATLALLLCLAGAYSLNNGGLDLWMLVVFGVFGYGLRTLRRSLFIARGDWTVITGRSLTRGLLVLGLLVLGLLARALPPFTRLARRAHQRAPEPAGAVRS
jgi:TctA family transporter